MISNKNITIVIPSLETIGSGEGEGRWIGKQMVCHLHWLNKVEVTDHLSFMNYLDAEFIRSLGLPLGEVALEVCTSIVFLQIPTSSDGPVELCRLGVSK